jgi:HEAT repeat protein
VRLAHGSAATASRVFDDPALAGSGTRMLEALLDPPGVPIDGAAAIVRFRREIAQAARESLTGFHENSGAVLAAFGEADTLSPLATAESIRSTEGARDALAGIIADIVPSLGNLVTHPDAALRRNALRILATTDAPEAVAALARAASDSDETIAAIAVLALARHHDDPAAYDAVLARLEPTAPWSLRTAAATALGAMADPRATDRLLALVRDDEFEYVRVAAARSLHSRRDQPAVHEALEHAARSDPDASVREAAREAAAD